MVEVIDQDTLSKLMAMILCGIQYDKKRYIVYVIRREQEDANVFVSRLVQNSQGMVIDYQFENGEKETLEKIVQRILSKESKESLAKDGIVLFRNFQLSEINYFDIQKCYVTTVLVSLIKECMIYYELLDEQALKVPTVEVVESKKKFNEGFVSSLVLIILGIVLIIFCIVMIYGFFFKK